MREDATRPIAPIDAKKVQAIAATVPRPQRERSPEPEAAAAADAAPAPPEASDPPSAAPMADAHRTTDLAYQVEPESKRIIVQVVDRDTGEVVRSYPLFVPGQGATIDADRESAEADAPRGGLVDAKV